MLRKYSFRSAVANFMDSHLVLIGGDGQDEEKKIKDSLALPLEGREGKERKGETRRMTSGMRARDGDDGLRLISLHSEQHAEDWPSRAAAAAAATR
uniref:Uncharacterized protein n=1 Tax=Setaria digitata TaxID=48799 RepID=A0A915PIG7_9BILA